MEAHLIERKKEPLETEDERAWLLVQRQCKPFLASNFLPTAIRTLEQAITIAWKGRELGIPPLYALNSISVVNGRPCLSAELMLALIYKNHPGAQINFTTDIDRQNTECEATFQRVNGKPQRFKFTMDDANRAGLTSKSNWKQYPAAMLRSRLIAIGARAVFPDALMGLIYTDEEMESVQDATSSAPIEVEVKATEQPKETQPKATQPHITEKQWKALVEAEEQSKTEFIPPTKKSNYNGPLSEAQKKRMYAIGKANGWLPEEVKRLVLVMFNREHFIELTRVEYDEVCKALEKPYAKPPEMPDNYSAEAPH